MLERYKKNKKIIDRLLIGLAITIIVAVALELAIFKNIYSQKTAIDRVFILTLIVYFIDLHFFIDVKQIYNFIYKKRYIIALIILLLIVILGYSGSSINMYSQYIPSTEEENGVVLGKSREIRSDEWAVNTPISFSQNMYERNKLPYFGSIVRGTRNRYVYIRNFCTSRRCSNACKTIYDRISIGE